MPPALRTFSRKQLAVIDAPHGRRILLLDGSVRSGKTVPSIVRWLRYIAEAPPGKLLMSGRTRAALRNNVLDDLFWFVGPDEYRWVNRQEGELQVWGRTIRCVGAHDERSQDTIQGDTYAGWYADEIVLHPKTFVDQARARCSQDPGFIIWTCNPDGPYHPIHVEYIDPEAAAVRAKLVERITFTLDDNPGLSEDYKRTLRTSFTGVFFRRNVLGLWVMAEGVIYDALDLDAHGFTDERPHVFDSLALSLDYGTQNPLHALLIGTRGTTSWVLAEWRWCGREEGAQKTDAQYSQALGEWLGRTWDMAARCWAPGGIVPDLIYVDPSATSFIAQLDLDRWGGITHADSEVRAGISTVATRLGQGQIRIHRGCKHLIRELQSYAWDPKAALKGEDKPLKVNDHGPDALRYHERTRYAHASIIVAPETGGGESIWRPIR